MPLKNKKTGFTLVEIMVSVSIFVSVALLVTSAVITTSETNRKAQAIKVAIDNLSFALDSMSLKIRQGNTFKCLSQNTGSLYNGTIVGDNCSGGVGVVFLDPSSTKHVYLFDGVAPNRKISYCQTTETGNCTDFVDLTDSVLVDLTTVKFSVWNAESLSTNPPRPQGRPRVAVSIAGETKDPKTKTEFYLQTTASGK